LSAIYPAARKRKKGGIDQPPSRITVQKEREGLNRPALVIILPHRAQRIGGRGDRNAHASGSPTADRREGGGGGEGSTLLPPWEREASDEALGKGRGENPLLVSYPERGGLVTIPPQEKRWRGGSEIVNRLCCLGDYGKKKTACSSTVAIQKEERERRGRLDSRFTCL